MKYYSLLIICTIFCIPFGYTQPKEKAKLRTYFKWNNDLEQVLEDILHLRLSPAREHLQTSFQKDTLNLVPYYLEDYRDFYLAFIEGNPETLHTIYNKRKEVRLIQLAQGGSEDPYTLYTQVDIHLRWAMLYALYQNNMLAFKSIKRASVLLEKNEKRFPDFLPNKRARGVLYTMVGAIPSQYQWGATLAGLRGTIEQGVTELQIVIQQGKQQPTFVFRKEVQLLYGMLLLNIGNHSPAAWSYLDTALFNPQTNPMAAYILASHYMKTGNSVQSLALLEKRTKRKEEEVFPQLELLQANCKLYQLDQTAVKHYKNFLATHQGVNGIKEAYQRLAWLALLEKDSKLYFYYMKQLEDKGATITSADSDAMKESARAATTQRPHLKLLQARLYYDGGYYNQAYETLVKCRFGSVKGERNQVEYFYRKGRICQKINKIVLALEAFEETLKRGAKKPYYYACNAALQAGIVSESIKAWEQARGYYERCLKEKPNQYQTSLHQRAKKRLALLDKSEK